MSSTTPTGPELCALLAAIEPSAVPDERLLEVLSAEWRQLSYQQARVWAVMAEITSRDPMLTVPGGPTWTPDQVFDSAVDEIRAELRLTRRAARRELEHADAVLALPPVAQALRAGRIDRARAIVLAQGCWDLTPEQTSTLLDDVLPTAGEVTATGLAERVRRVAIALDPGWAERRYRQALTERRVIGYLNEDGSATVSGQHLPAGEAAAALARVNALAQAAKRAGAAGKIDALRAEVFLGLLDGRFAGMPESAMLEKLRAQFPNEDGAPLNEGPAAARSGVELRVALATLIGLEDRPGDIAGWGPVPASVARKLARKQRRCEWRFAVVDSDGRLVFDGTTRRRPPEPGVDAEDVRGGIVELQVPVALLADRTVREQHLAWSRLLADIEAQYRKQAPIEQDPAARFPGRPLRRRSQIRHRTCLFPGCRRPAADCDQDHRAEHARGGRTEEQNLGPGCRHDHGLKTDGGWRLVKRDDVTYVWISPLGRRHLATVDPVAAPLPSPVPRELPDPDPPPY